MIFEHLLRVPARFLAPLLVAVLALSLAVLSAWHHYSDTFELVEADVRSQLEARLTIEQTRLDVRGGRKDWLRVRRLVASLGLWPDITHAYLINDRGEILAALTRSPLGKPLVDALADQPKPIRDGLLSMAERTTLGLLIHRPTKDQALLAQMPIYEVGQLLVRADLSRPLAAHGVRNRNHLFLHSVAVLAISLLLWGLLHALWFRRAGDLVRTTQRLAGGDLDARTGVTGGDELAAIGHQIDTMAGRLAQQRNDLQRLSDIIERSPAVVVQWRNSPGWPIDFISRNVRHWNYKADEFLSGKLSYADLIHPEDRSRISQEVARHLSVGPDDYTQEYRLRDGRGNWLWVDDRTWLERDANGEVTGIHGVVLDVSERKRAQLALQDSENRYRYLYEQNPAPMLIYARDSLQLLSVNAAFITHYGFTHEQATRLKLTELYPESERAAIIDLADRLQGHANVGEWHHRKRDGSEITIVARSHDLEFANRRARIAVITDITERKKAEIALQQQADLLGLFYDLPFIGMAITSPETKSWVKFNDRLCEILGYSRDELASKNWPELTHPEDLEADVGEFNKVLAGDSEGYAMDKRFVRKDGRVIFASIDVRCVRHTDGSVDYFVATVQDISERRAAEQRIQQLNAELEQRVIDRTAQLQAANQELETFAYSVSHDLKAPLRGIDGYSQLLLNDCRSELNDECRSFIENVQHGAKRMAALIEDLLAYSQMERESVSRESIELQTVVDEALGELASDLIATGARVSVDLPEAHVLGDRNGIMVVLRNLLQNALKFRREAEPPQIKLSGATQGDKLCLSIADNGIGFDMRCHDRIFEIFQRLNHAEAYPGTGIGLALVRKAMQRMGGRVWAESAPGEGARLFLEFDLSGTPTDDRGEAEDSPRIGQT